MNYSNHYNLLIERAKTRVLDGYSEQHHVIPRCIGGSDDADNLVRLTAEEHFVAHQLLAKIHPNSIGLIFAVLTMGARINNKKYGWVRRQFAEKMRTIDRSGWESSKRRSDEHKKNIAKSIKKTWESEKRRRLQSQAMTGRKFSEQHKQKLSLAKKGRKLSDEAREALRQCLIGRKVCWKIIVCPHCQKSGGTPNMRRYHFDKCKSRAENQQNARSR
jgi:hypothetical protein